MLACIIDISAITANGKGWIGRAPAKSPIPKTYMTVLETS
jgi:hypothetical protein